LWQALADEIPVSSVGALIELAKYWEHRRGDPARARELALMARERWQAHLPPQERPIPGLGRWSVGVAAPAPPDDFARRLARLEGKQTRYLSGQ
jgi:hypothetical protein